MLVYVYQGGFTTPATSKTVHFVTIANVFPRQSVKKSAKKEN